MIGRTAGTTKGIKYTRAMVAYSETGVAWSTETLDTSLVAPRNVVNGIKMDFPALKNAADRANVITYLMQFSIKE